MSWVICLKINRSILCNERFKHYQGNFKIENYCRSWDESQTGTPQPFPSTAGKLPPAGMPARRSRRPRGTRASATLWQAEASRPQRGTGRPLTA